MYLKSLTVRGFKSFASATVFEFEPGLNVLVGPNGSGKSNVVDALAWVMGAQGAKALRGAAMKDVIFSGGGSRGALGRAKVELVIDNSDGSLPLPHAEIKLTRTMFSAGGSEYDINGEPARLADVQELLADTGVGRELYTLVGQGQVDRILHGTAADRRELIEQAAGLLKHRKRQSKTAGKLEDLTSHLDRLEDLASELSDQLEGRREQAEAARVATEVAARVRSLSADLLALDAQAVAAERADEETAGQGAAEARVRAEERGKKAQDRLKDLTDQEAQVRQNLAAATQDAEGLQALIQRVQALGLVAQERASQATSRPDDSGAEDRHRRAKEALEVEQETLRAAEEQEVGAEATRTRAAQELQDAQARHTLAQEALAEAEAKSQAHREELAAATQTLASARAVFERAQEEAARRAQEQEEHTLARSQRAGELARRQENLGRSEAELAELREQEKSAREVRQQAGSLVEQTRANLHQAEVKVESLQARVEALESAWAHDGQALGDDVSARELALEQGAQELIALLEIETGWERAVGALLGPALRALVVEKPGASLEEVSTLLPAHRANHLNDLEKLPQDIADLEGYLALPQVVQAPQGVMDSLTYLFPQTLFCEDLSSAQRLLDTWPRAQAVTRQGAVLTAVSQLHLAGAADAASLHSQLAQARTDLDLARAASQQAGTDFEEAQAAREQARSREQELARAIGTLAASWATEKAELASLTGREDGSTAEEQRLAEATRRAQQALTQARENLEQAVDALEKLRAEAPQYDLAALGKAVHSTAQQLQEATAASTVAEATYTFAQEKAQEGRARLTQAAAALEALKEADRSLAEAREEARHRAEKARALLLKTEAFQQAVEPLLEAARTSVQKAQAQRETLEQDLADTRQDLQIAQTSLAASLTLYADSATRRARVESRWEALEARAVEEFHVELADLMESRQVTEEDRPHLEAKLRQDEAQLARLGVTNPLALEEYKVLQERHAYLTQQIQDIKASRSDVQAVMKEVSSHIETSFDSAFADVQEHFTSIFATLFPGGQGQLVLSDPNDRDASGIDIQVKPAGKKVTRLSLLSGGERTLASLALLLAVFMARPAPFYVLDEVEAALDDRNLGRLLEVLGQLRQKSQLLMITHHQRTMAEADTLYGISMRDGVSTVLSHRMGQS
ncbi:chromosome segregation protein SMC [Rothia nasimurium]|uniref:chromosome segregation protein SMC n=1 Tax=Rothia nasimurium TaxID=85336 RepID=UPI001F02D069|nr:chromosome segregation protein SMC [Rothia nasimurium]